MDDKDIRWTQRFSNYRKALAKLSAAVVNGDVDSYSDLEKEGLVKRFEYTYELAWKTLQDLLREKGYPDIAGPTPVIQQAFQDGYIKNGKDWMNMKKSREITTHTYDEDAVNDIVKKIIEVYYDLLNALEIRLEEERSGKQKPLSKQ